MRIYNGKCSICDHSFDLIGSKTPDGDVIFVKCPHINGVPPVEGVCPGYEKDFIYDYYDKLEIFRGKCEYCLHNENLRGYEDEEGDIIYDECEYIGKKVPVMDKCYKFVSQLSVPCRICHWCKYYSWVYGGGILDEGCDLHPEKFNSEYGTCRDFELSENR